MCSDFAPARIGLVASCIVVAILIAGGPLGAQEMTGDLQYRVVDSLGNAIPGVNATVTGPLVQGTRGASSDALGYVRIPGLHPGRALVRISHSAYQPVVFENVQIQLGRTTNLGELKLQGRMHEMPGLVVSAVRSPMLDPLSTQSGGNLRAAEFEGLPVDPTYKSIVTLLPQANRSYFADEVNVAGGTGMDNKYYVDGVDAADSYLNWSGTTLPYNFVSEIELREGGYEAEYAGALGGVVNIITPAGGNELHGTLSGFLGGNRFTPNKKLGLYDITQLGYSEYNVGFGLGGPLVHDQLWFYAAYNPQSEQQEVPVPGFGTALDRSVTHSFAGKLTWRASPNIQVMLMTTGDPTARLAVGEGMVGDLGNPDPFLVDRKLGGVNFSLRGSYASESGFLLNASVSRSTRNQDWVGATERGRTEPLFTDTRTGRFLWSGGVGSYTKHFVSTTAYSVDATLPAGSHVLKGGMQFKVAGVDDDEAGKSISLWPGWGFIVDEFGIHTSVGYNIPSLFLQDNWQISEMLRMHLGLRWDSQYMIASDGTVAQKFLNEFSPRAGITFMFDERQKLSASFGRFYQELSSSNATTYTDQDYYVRVLYGEQDPRIDPSGGYTDVQKKRLEATGLKGQYFDEFTLGYERLIREDLKMSVQGIYRTLRQAVGEVTLLPDYETAYGNPGSGLLSQAPKARHDYSALVVMLQGYLTERLNILASYVLSRNYGNYSGLFEAINHTWNTPNGPFLFYLADDPSLSTGLLPNDRTHVFKLAMSYGFDFGLSTGAFFSWQTGTPLSEMAGTTRFLSKRGTAGRTPAIWDLNARFAYELPLFTGLGTRLYLDVLHIASQQKPVDILQSHYYWDSPPDFPVPNYGDAIKYQPAMAARFGMELKF